MLTPEYLLHCSERAEAVAEEIHRYATARIVKGMINRLQRGDNYVLTSRDAWLMRTMEEAGKIREDIVKELVVLTGAGKEEIRKAIEEAGVDAARYDDTIYEAAGIDVSKPVKESPYFLRFMQANYNMTAGQFENFTGTTADAAQQTFIRACDRAYTHTSMGLQGYTAAVADAVEDAAREGVRIYYPSGHVDTIETATLRAVRTGVGQMAADISMQRMEEENWDIVLVSAHIGARYGDGEENASNHFWWQGKFYSRSGKDKRFLPFSVTGYGTGPGLCGWNCRHSFGAGDGVHNPFDPIDTAENKKAYDLSQQQRKMERTIRKQKRTVMALHEGYQACDDAELREELFKRYAGNAKRLQRMNGEYNEFCEENNLKRLADRLKISGWDRSEASAATAAARKA